MDILVARGNKQFKMATKHEIERKLTDAAQSTQEMKVLVAMGNNWFQDGHQTWNRGDTSHSSPQIQEIEFMKSMATVREAVYRKVI